MVKKCVMLGLFLPIALLLIGCSASVNVGGGGNTGGGGPQHSRFVYVVNTVSSSVSGFSVNPVNGALTSVGPAVPGAANRTPSYAAVTPSSSFLYVANTGGSSVSGFAINGITGVLTPLNTPEFTTTGDTQPFGIAIDPAGAHLYTANQRSISAFNINTLTGALSSVPGTPVASTDFNALPEQLKVTPNGKFLYVANGPANTVSGYTFNNAGLPVSIGAGTPAGSFPLGLVVDPASRFVYVSSINSHDISAFSINATTGALTQIGLPISLPNSCRSAELAVDKDSKFLFATCQELNTVAQLNIDATTGALSQVNTTLVTTGAPHGIALDASGAFAYVTLSNVAEVQTANVGTNGTISSAPVNPSTTGANPIGVVVTGTQ
jgi:6-phosphogluconolactonase